LFGRVHPRFKTPYVTTALTGAVVALVAGLFPIATLTQLTAMGTLLAFVMVSIGVWMLRRTSPELHRPFKTPWMPWVPILGALICLAQMAALPGTTWVRLIVWLVAGLAIYFLYGKNAALRQRTKRQMARAA
jgi:APA family basic amino acid/polyamine antiporter